MVENVGSMGFKRVRMRLAAGAGVVVGCAEAWC